MLIVEFISAFCARFRSLRANKTLCYLGSLLIFITDIVCIELDLGLFCFSNTIFPIDCYILTVLFGKEVCSSRFTQGSSSYPLSQNGLNLLSFGIFAVLKFLLRSNFGHKFIKPLVPQLALLSQDFPISVLGELSLDKLDLKVSSKRLATLIFNWHGANLLSMLARTLLPATHWGSRCLLWDHCQVWVVVLIAVLLQSFVKWTNAQALTHLGLLLLDWKSLSRHTLWSLPEELRAIVAMVFIIG